MKKILILIALATTLTAQEHKIDDDGFMVPVDNKEWTTSTKTLLYTYYSLSAIDLIQTINFLEKGTAHEANPLFGKHPKPATLIATKIGVSVGMYYMADFLPNDFRKVVLPILVIGQGLIVKHNAQYVNINISF